ncbi:MAG: hypothetical protein LUC98_08800 [Lachnospiraceae bacterium]|nr:hypothetical protein [Lachnospiraceae bacterium]
MLPQKSKNDDLLFCGLIVLFCVQDLLQSLIGPFRALEELVALSVVVLFFLELCQTQFTFRFQTNTLVILLFLALFLLTGGVSTLLYGSQPLSNVLSDILVWMKFPAAMAVGYLMTMHRNKAERYAALIRLLDVVTACVTVLFLADLVLHIFPADIRSGLRAVKLFYSAYTYCAAVMCFICAIYFRMYEFLGDRVLLRLLPLWVIMVSTLRFKAICAVFFMVFVFLIICQRRRAFGPLMWGMLGAGGLLLGIRSILYYYVTLQNESARAALSSTALQIVRDYFPLGTGFATFGSAFSAEPYSRVYELYHINHIWGISETYHSFISDSFWPYLMGETGILGTVFYCAALIAIFWRLSRLRLVNAFAYGSALVCFIYLLISSTGESAFTNTFGVYFGLWIGVMLSEEGISHEVA